MSEILAGEATPSQIAGFAVALRAKGETIDELQGLVDAMYRQADGADEMRRAVREQLRAGADFIGQHLHDTPPDPRSHVPTSIPDDPPCSIGRIYRAIICLGRPILGLRAVPQVAQAN